MKSYESRALSAYFKSEDGMVQQPTTPEIMEIKDRKYVVLHNVNGVLAVYRIKTDDILKRLKRYPKEIDLRF
jgi:hypothetical protein